MNVERHQAVIIGGGPAGLAAAIRLRQKGIDDVVVLEREHRPGGILRQCIHDLALIHISSFWAATWRTISFRCSPLITAP